MHVKSLTPRIRNEVLYKRWKELRPSFVRLTHQWRKAKDGSDEELIAAMKQETDTRVYLTTWGFTARSWACAARLPPSRLTSRT